MQPVLAAGDRRRRVDDLREDRRTLRADVPAVGRALRRRRRRAVGRRAEPRWRRWRRRRHAAGRRRARSDQHERSAQRAPRRVDGGHAAKRSGGAPTRSVRARDALALECRPCARRAPRPPRRPVDPLPEARRADPRDRDPARHDRRHRPRHRLRARLPGLAALPRPAAAAARRRQGLDRVDPPDASRRSSASRSSAWRSSPCATTATGRRSLWPSLGGRRRSSGSRRGSGARPSASATAGSRSRRTWPRRCCSSALLVYVTVRAGYPGPPRRPGRAASGSRCSPPSRRWPTFALLLFGSQVTATDSRARLPGLAADERLARAAAHRADRRPTSCIAGWRPSSALIVVGVAVVAWRTQRDRPDARPARGRRGGPLRDPGRRSAGCRS